MYLLHKSVPSWVLLIDCPREQASSHHTMIQCIDRFFKLLRDEVYKSLLTWLWIRFDHFPVIRCHDCMTLLKFEFQEPPVVFAWISNNSETQYCYPSLSVSLFVLTTLYSSRLSTGTMLWLPRGRFSLLGKQEQMWLSGGMQSASKAPNCWKVTYCNVAGSLCMSCHFCWNIWRQGVTNSSLRRRGRQPKRYGGHWRKSCTLPHFILQQHKPHCKWNSRFRCETWISCEIYANSCESAARNQGGKIRWKSIVLRQPHSNKAQWSKTCTHARICQCAKPKQSSNWNINASKLQWIHQLSYRYIAEAE